MDSVGWSENLPHLSRAAHISERHAHDSSTGWGLVCPHRRYEASGLALMLFVIWLGSGALAGLCDDLVGVKRRFLLDRMIAALPAKNQAITAGCRVHGHPAAL
jgi:hypothetical protein